MQESNVGRSTERGVAFTAKSIPGIKQLWKETLGDPEIRVALLDGPVDLSHPCFAGADLERLPTLVSASGPSDHGTLVTSLIFAQPGNEVTGIAPRCRGLILPVFNQVAGGKLGPCSQQDLAFNISQALENGAHVINISGGELTSAGTGNDFLQSAVSQAAERNVLIVAAAGNDGCECLHVPAAMPKVLSVGALGLDSQPLNSSNWSPRLEGIVAPGALIKGALAGGNVGMMSGTSFATPLVSGVAALLLSLQKKYGLPVDAMAVRDALLDSAIPCDPRSTISCERLLRGALNVQGACDLVLRSIRDSSEIHRSTTTMPLFEGEIMSENSNSAVQPQDAATIAATPSGNGSGQKAASGQEAIEVVPAQIEPSCVGQPRSAPGLQDRDSIAAPLEAIESMALAPASTVSSAINIAPQSAGAVSATVSPLEPVNIASQVVPSCQSDSAFTPFPSGQKVFTIGKLYYDFGTEARRDDFIAQIRAQYVEQGIKKEFNQGLVYNPEVMVKYLFNLPQKDPITDDTGDFKPKEKNNLDYANALIWTAYIDQDPVYALVPEDQFGLLSFMRLTTFLKEQIKSKSPETFRVAAAGTIGGSATLFNGTTVPTVQLLARGMYDWDIETLVGDSGVSKYLKDFLLRIYNMLRNLGVTSEDRAKNFAATNLYQAKDVIKQATDAGFMLDNIFFDRSAICRRNSDCWDVKLIFFNPKNMFQDARLVYEYTIDVSDVIPVQVGEVRQYPIYGGPNS